MRRRRLLGRTLLMALMLIVPFGLYAQPVFAASSATCTACEDEDPNTWRVYTDPYDSYLCADDAINAGYAVDPANPDNYAILRYSPRCRTVWTKRIGSGIDIGISRNSPAKTLYCCAASGPWTNMLNDAGYISQAWIHDSSGYYYSIWY